MSKRQKIDVENPDFTNWISTLNPEDTYDEDSDNSDDQNHDDSMEVYDRQAGGSDDEDFEGILVQDNSSDDSLHQPNGCLDATNDDESDPDLSDKPWADGAISPKVPRFEPNIQPGPLASLRKQQPRPIDFFQLFFPDWIVQHISDETNRYAEDFLRDKTLRPKSRFRQWYATTKNEMWAFFGMIVAMSLVKVDNLKDYWSKDPVFGNQFVKAIMPRDRFLLILTFLHLNDNKKMLPRHPGYDPLFKLRPIIDCQTSRFGSLWQPFENLGIDEAAIAWNGPLGFKCYNKDKPEKYHVKAYEAGDSSNGYIMKYEIYTGKTNASKKEATYDVVMRLMDPFLNQGYKLYLDNFYTSPTLFMDLWRKKTGACGTLRLVRKGVDIAMKQKKIVKNKGDSKIMNNGTINHVKFMDRKEVNIITTFHTAEIVDTGKLDKKTKEPIMKYAAVHDYNKYMGAVDLSDQFLTYTAVKRRTIKWWKKVFLHLFALSEVNTYLFYKETMKRKANIKCMDHKSFRKELCKDMTSLMPMKPLSPRLRNACVGETDILRCLLNIFQSLFR